MAAAYPIPSFLQLPIEGLADDEPGVAGKREDEDRPREAALARSGSLRLTRSLRPPSGADEPAGMIDEAEPAPRSELPAAVPAPKSAPKPAVKPAVKPAPAVAGASPVDVGAHFDREASLATWRAWLAAWELDTDPAPVVDALVECVGDPRRRFHNLERVASELAWLGQWRDAARDPVAIGLAIWFRYATLDPARCDNEARSAEFARIGLAGLGVGTVRIRQVRELVVSTREGAVASSPDAKLLADIGRARLGELPGVFDRHEEDLRAESVHIVDAIYWRRRIAAIRAMLIKPRVYFTDIARSRLEAAARGNLSRRLEAR